jgi:hypothetical protein
VAAAGRKWIWTATFVAWATLGLVVGFVVRFLLTFAGPPVWWHYGVFGAAWLAPLAAVGRRAHRLAAVGTSGVFIVVLGAGYGAAWNSHDRFLRDLAKVSPGMTREQVAEVMTAYRVGSGWPSPPQTRSLEIVGGGSYEAGTDSNGEMSIDGCTIFRHSDDGDWDSDWGIVCFSADRVATVEFSPD